MKKKKKKKRNREKGIDDRRNSRIDRELVDGVSLFAAKTEKFRRVEKDAGGERCYETSNCGVLVSFESLFHEKPFFFTNVLSFPSPKFVTSNLLPFLL